MNYLVEWAPLAVDELGAVWVSSTDQVETAHQAYVLEELLANAPFTVGQPVGSSVTRIVLLPPLGLAFDIVEDDKKVIVQSCWLVAGN